MSSDRDRTYLRRLKKTVPGYDPCWGTWETHRLRVLHWEKGSEYIGPVSIAWFPVPCTSSTVCTHRKQTMWCKRKGLNLCTSCCRCIHWMQITCFYRVTEMGDAWLPAPCKLKACTTEERPAFPAQLCLHWGFSGWKAVLFLVDIQNGKNL